MAENDFKLLIKIEELYAALTNGIMNRRVPAALRYSVGESILRELAEVGSLVYMANEYCYRGQNYKAKSQALLAYDSFLKVEYKTRLFLQDTRINLNRGHIFGLETEFKKMLGSWTNALTSSGRR